MDIYVCGNPLVNEDSLPLQILPELKKRFSEITFYEFDPTDDWPQKRELVIIDTIINAKEVIIVDDIDSFVSIKPLSLHDFDLGINLKLAKKLGMVEKVVIIGVPPNMEKNNAIKEVCSAIKKTIIKYKPN